MLELMVGYLDEVVIGHHTVITYIGFTEKSNAFHLSLMKKIKIDIIWFCTVKVEKYQVPQCLWLRKASRNPTTKRAEELIPLGFEAPKKSKLIA
ncbi:hypothetical protein [Zooshikella ganghwensis]|uniref:Uncharacterized protein n=1 Tax=Zooshikella ganghwensis TaxID=202772 RepID=A0A4P9VDR8_9GAMM|nr:hypothetical protein [Zooshikella ganghwensis]RDH41215.1 hypothetical protein B9G39_29915 [Zooshikella ganghwensis]